MNAATFKAILRALGLNQTDAANICRRPGTTGRTVSDRTVRNWCAGVPVPDYAVEALSEAALLADQLLQNIKNEAKANPEQGATVHTFRTTAEMHEARPELAEYPASFLDAVAGRAHITATAGEPVTIEYVDGTP